MKIEAHNRSNAEKRRQITFEAWTQLYTALKVCTEKTAPATSRHMMELCDLCNDGIKGGYFDGPLF